MGKVNDFIAGFDPENIPETFSNDLLNAYNDDLSIYDSKIGSLESTIADKESALSAAHAEVSAVKSRNYDLLMSVKGDADNSDIETQHDGDESTDVDFDDLFGF